MMVCPSSGILAAAQAPPKKARKNPDITTAVPALLSCMLTVADIPGPGDADIEAYNGRTHNYLV
jgi:hypothetical protein